MKKNAVFMLALCLLVSLATPALGASEVEYLPGVTEEMCSPEFWTAMMEDPDALLATAEDIARINRTALDTPGCNMHDLKGLPATFNGLARNESLPKGAAADAAYYLGWTYDSTGKKFTQEDFDAIIANTVDPNATEEMPLGYGIAVNRALLVCFPYEGQILDDPADLDFDYQGLVGIRVNEPVAVFTTSADGKFYQVFTSTCSGWVRVEDIALCRSREEWLSAWDLPAEKRLVFCGDKLYTDYSKSSPETSCRLITMGTVLERMEEMDFGTLVTNRQPLHNYAVYLPIRNEDGGYGKVPALVNARGPFSEDYLPLTGRNLATVALVSLGDAYGWGATLNNEDCSSLNRTVFTCFGLDLPRNENWQRPLPMPEADVSDMSTEEKLAILDSAPLGTILNFPGHQMMYLGKAEGEYFVVSTVSSIMNPVTGKRQRTRDVQINTLELRRANGKTWLQALNSMYIPWVSLEADEPLGPQLWYREGTAYCLAQGLIDVYDGGFFQPGKTATRAVTVEALWRAAGRPEAGGEVEAFPDVASDAAYASAALWAKEKSVIQGIDGNFAPDTPISREMLAVVLFRCAELQGLDTGPRATLDGFTDGGNTADWAKEAARWAVGCGLLRGNADGSLNPQGNVTRAELAVLLQRLSTLEPAETNPAPDYADPARWVAIPETLAHEADTFFILPTVNMRETEVGNEDIYNERKASRFVKTLGIEGGIAGESTDVYAPFYRQATIASYLDENGMMTDMQAANDAMEYDDIAYGDIRAAWLYYLENWNNGRPVLLFGYSQGADMVLRLLAEFGAESALADRLVAAYVIGASVDEAYLTEHPWLQMARGETDTGVIISYNAADARMEKPETREYAINPLNWKTDSTPASKEENLGFVVTDVTGAVTQELPAYCGAYLDPDSGKLIITEADNLEELYVSTGSPFPAGDYHMYDLYFFYRNLQKNIADRVESFLHL